MVETVDRRLSFGGEDVGKCGLLRLPGRGRRRLHGGMGAGGGGQGLVEALEGCEGHELLGAFDQRHRIMLG